MWVRLSKFLRTCLRAYVDYIYEKRKPMQSYWYSKNMCLKVVMCWWRQRHLMNKTTEFESRAYKKSLSFTFGPNEVSFIAHSMVNRIVKTRLQSARTSVYSRGAPWYCAKIREGELDIKKILQKEKKSYKCDHK